MDVINPSSHNHALLWNWRIVHGLAIFSCISSVSSMTITPFITENKVLRGLALGYSLVAGAAIECCYNHLTKIAPRVKAIHERDTASFRSEITADFHVANVTNAMIGDYFVEERKASLQPEMVEIEPEPFYAAETPGTLVKSDVSELETISGNEKSQSFSPVEISETEIMKALKSISEGDSQTMTIFKTWGVRPGGSKAYKEALAKYKQIEMELENEDGSE